jgi:hypothetical protein
MAGNTLMSGKGHIPEMASNRARRPTARLVASTEVCHRDRLIRSTSLRKGRDHCAHLVKRCVANDRLVRKRWAKSADRADHHLHPGKAMARLATSRQPQSSWPRPDCRRVSGDGVKSGYCRGV